MFNLLDEVRQKRDQAVSKTGWVECLVSREGDTIVNLAGFPYRFRRNQEGRCVCEVVNSYHYSHMIRMPGTFRPYTPQQAADAGKDVAA